VLAAGAGSHSGWAQRWSRWIGATSVEQVDVAVEQPEDLPTIAWVEGAVVVLDQRRLPREEVLLRLTTVDELIDAVQSLAVRGAPVLGVAGAFGVALAAHTISDPDQVRAAAERIALARPTAVNLAWGARRAAAKIADGPAAVLAEAREVLAEDAQRNLAASTRAADILLRLCWQHGAGRDPSPGKPLKVMTHCNAGRLAASGRGTSLGAVRELADRGALELVIATETRPLLQGARLTAWELWQSRIPYRVCTDGAAPALISWGMVDCVIVGADRIAANGDTANKIGTYSLALAAHQHGIPFVVVAPESTVDEELATGDGIVIEQRSGTEVTSILGMPVAPEGSIGVNPAFDITPAEIITAIATERRDLLAERRTAVR
jgi:methylthioribose-1-phosphate isomerase